MQRERPSDVFCDEPTRGVLDHTDGVDDGVDWLNSMSSFRIWRVPYQHVLSFVMCLILFRVYGNSALHYVLGMTLVKVL
jgi:hypothetical protein